jgi:hypothetical protein
MRFSCWRVEMDQKSGKNNAEGTVFAELQKAETMP